MASKKPPRPQLLYSQGAPSNDPQPPVGASVSSSQQQVQGLALDKYRDAMMRRVGGGSALGGAVATPNSIADIFKKRTSRRVLRGMTGPNESGYQ